MAATVPGVGATAPAPPFIPPDTTTLQGLISLYLLQDWLRVHQHGHDCRPGWFRRHGVVVGLAAESRASQVRLARRTDCVACGKPVSADSTGDHVLAVANGGPAGLENFLPLCGRCNSSKGTKDLLAWWQAHGRRPDELPPDVLATYARIHFRHGQRTRTLATPMPSALTWALEGLLALLPTLEHQRACWSRVWWVTGW